MQLDKQQAVFKQLKEEFDQMGMVSKFIAAANELQTGETLMLQVPVRDTELFVLMEIMAASFDEDIDFIQLHATWVMGISGADARAELLKVIPYMNLSSAVGLFGIDDTAGGSNFYHKYTVLANVDTPAEVIAGNVTTALAAIYEVVSLYFSLVSELASGGVGYAEAVEKFSRKFAN